MRVIYEAEVISNDLFDGDKPNEKVVKSGVRYKTGVYSTHTLYILGQHKLGTKVSVVITDEDLEPEGLPTDVEHLATSGV